MKKYIFEEGMSEISGMGGSYERSCRDMLKAGLDFWDEHPGLISEDNEDAKALRDVVIADCDCTGAMYQAVITTIFWIRKNGWDEYVRMMKEVRNEKSRNKR